MEGGSETESPRLLRTHLSGNVTEAGGVRVCTSPASLPARPMAGPGPRPANALFCLKFAALHPSANCEPLSPVKFMRNLCLFQGIPRRPLLM